MADDRYQYDPDVVEAAIEETAAELYEAGRKGKPDASDYGIDALGNLKIGGAVIENISPAAKRSRIKEIGDGLRVAVYGLIKRANKKAELEEKS